ncbi:GH39 family glycosyl hydrolase [Sphingomonas sp. CLY1604]|uniref:GH39 family glycosyl hydrolase n=1 Tax=Sphingomonas sp. CLY1604 TaxID=3457786 RepID=UPI003FD8FC26
MFNREASLERSVGTTLGRRSLLGLMAGGAAISFAPRVAAASAAHKTLDVDVGSSKGRIRNLQGVNRGPIADWDHPDLTKQYRELRVSMIRTHDFYGAFDIDSRYLRKGDPQLTSEHVPVDTLTTIFPDPNADPDRASSYDFSTSDRAMRAILAAGAEPYYRVGRSWGADTTPPDPDLYARVVRNVARHYGEGWAGGFDARIRYWEIWNEPDFPAPFWSGSPEQYYHLYASAARALKAVNSAFRVGGPGKAWTLHEDAYRTAFIRYCRINGVPLDFYSWHSYTNASANPFDLVRFGRTIRGLLDANGFPKAESHVTEWAYGAGVAPAGPVADAAYRAAGLIYMQDAPIEVSTLYHGQALFGSDGSFTKAAHAVKAVGSMLDTPIRLACTGADELGYAMLAGRSESGARLQILIANYQPPAVSPMSKPFSIPETMPLETKTFLERMVSEVPADSFLPFVPHDYSDNGRYNVSVRNTGWTGDVRVTRRRLDALYDLTAIEEVTLPAAKLVLTRDLPAPGVELIELTPV